MLTSLASLIQATFLPRREPFRQDRMWGCALRLNLTSLTYFLASLRVARRRTQRIMPIRTLPVTDCAHKEYDGTRSFSRSQAEKQSTTAAFVSSGTLARVFSGSHRSAFLSRAHIASESCFCGRHCTNNSVLSVIARFHQLTMDD